MSYDENNIFARILRDELPSERVYEDDDTLVIMDIMPRAPGHMLVLPKGPARNLLDATPDQLCACIAVAKRVAEAAKVAFNADGVTLQQFSEAAGGILFGPKFIKFIRLSDIYFESKITKDTNKQPCKEIHKIPEKLFSSLSFAKTSRPTAPTRALTRPSTSTTSTKVSFEFVVFSYS